MLEVVERKHTDAAEQRRFLAMTTQEQLLEIFLNGRETNGHVADLTKRADEMEPVVKRHERYFIGFAAIVAAIIFGAPFLFWGLEQLSK